MRRWWRWTPRRCVACRIWLPRHRRRLGLTYCSAPCFRAAYVTITVDTSAYRRIKVPSPAEVIVDAFVNDGFDPEGASYEVIADAALAALDAAGYTVTREQPEVHCDCGKSYVGQECYR